MTRTSPASYLLIFAVLVGLTIATLTLAHVDLGYWHTLIGLGIALTKALLIVLFFMHLWAGNRFFWVVALAGVFWFVLLLSLALCDYLTRPWAL